MSKKDPKSAVKCGLPGCDNEGTKTCSRCKIVSYCSRECQKKHWKAHKMECMSPQEAKVVDKMEEDQHTLHKREFDRIRKKYGLDQDEKAGEMADFLTSTDMDDEGKISAQAFADKFNMEPQEAVVFLEWIKVGVKFKEECLQNAQNL